MRVLITGASGFIGKNLIKTFLDDDVEILAISRKKNRSQKNICWIRDDLNNVESLFPIIMKFQPTIIYHLAWEGIPDFSFRQCAKNIKCSIDFLQHISRVNSIKKIIITGTCLEYSQRNGICNENDVINPVNWFEWSKNLINIYSRMIFQDKDIKIYWARLFYVYGQFQRKESLIPSIMKSFKMGLFPEIKNISNCNDFINVFDVTNGLNKFATIDAPSGIYNFGSGQLTEVMEIVKTLETQFFKNNHLTNSIKFKENYKIKKVGFFADIKKSKKYLNWAPKVNLNLGLKGLLKQ